MGKVPVQSISGRAFQAQHLLVPHYAHNVDPLSLDAIEVSAGGTTSWQYALFAISIGTDPLRGNSRSLSTLANQPYESCKVRGQKTEVKGQKSEIGHCSRSLLF